MTPTLLALGGATILAAVAGWWITFGDVVRFGYLSWRKAGGCVVQNSDICSLAKALCLGSHPRLLFAYWASVFWLGILVLSASLITSERTRVAQSAYKEGALREKLFGHPRLGPEHPAASHRWS